jgi:hypothetical protein
MVAPPQLNGEWEKNLRLDALPLFARQALLRCAELPFFASGNWYLAGGTALALQAGHRESQDLDFFTTEKSFDIDKAEQRLGSEKTWQTESRSEGTLFGELLNAKISLIAYPFFRPAERMLSAGSVSILRPADIAVMKIAAISQRGRKRDFIDLYWLCRNVEPLSESLKRVDTQYTISQNPNHLLKSLAYFADAEDDPMPTLFFKASWEDVKAYFRREAPRVAKELMGLR